MKGKQKLFFITFAFIAIASITTFYFYSKKDSNTQANRQDDFDNYLVNEFANAYAQDTDPNGNIVELDMVAKEDEVEIIDGYKTKVWAYNKTVPGPEIRIKLGDTLKVNFRNELPDETTIHWHGVRVPNAMDGVPGVTQDPIQPGDSFTYEFTPKDAGTFWFHPHVRGAEQVERGLFGSLIVEDDYSKNYTSDIVWVIDDWRLTEDAQVYANFVTPMDISMNGRWGNVITVNASQNTIAKVRPGERIRLRLINSSNARVYKPQIPGIEAFVIAVDGMYVKEPFLLNDFELAPGNRLDLDITVPTSTSEKTFVLTDSFTKNVNNLAKIKVSGERMETPNFAMPKNLNIPDWEKAIDAKIDKQYVLDIRRTSSGPGMMGGIEWTINGKAYPNYEPIDLKFGEFNKIRITNNSTRIHPIHLHGQFFKVIAIDASPSEEKFFRDTILLHPNETIDVGLVPLDKGYWLSHCHILEHAEAGMTTVVNVK